MKKHYRDESGEIRYGKVPDNHPSHYYQDKHRKKVKKGHTVEFKKHGDEKRTGRVVNVGEHGISIHCKDKKHHKVLHHEVIGHIGGKDVFQDHKKVVDLKKAMIKNSVARGHLSALEGAINMLQGLSTYNHTNKLNNYKYKLQALRNKIIGGSDIPSQDLENGNRLIRRAGREIAGKNKSKFQVSF